MLAEEGICSSSFCRPVGTPRLPISHASVDPEMWSSTFLGTKVGSGVARLVTLRYNLIQITKEDNKEYMWGLYALSAFIYAFFFTWTVWLLYQRFYAEDPGWKSGKFLLQRPTEALKEAEEYKDEDHVHETIATAHPIRKMELVAEEAPAKLKKFRKIFVFFAINYILFAILFVTKGMSGSWTIALLPSPHTYRRLDQVPKHNCCCTRRSDGCRNPSR